MAGSNTFGGTIKLEGEKAYREALKQINSNLRVLASEMGKVTAEFNKNTRSPRRLRRANAWGGQLVDSRGRSLFRYVVAGKRYLKV